MIDTLADLHAIDVSAQPLSDLGKPAGFVERQVRGWSERWHRSQTTPLPEMDALAEWLRAHLPADPPARRSSTATSSSTTSCSIPTTSAARRGVRLGDERARRSARRSRHRARLLVPTAPPEQRDALTTVTDRPGYFTRMRCSSATPRVRRDVSTIRYYEIFAVFKIAVVIQQIYYRYVQGQTTDSRFATFDARVAYLARHAAACGPLTTG
jgi:hypothetical protein